MFYLTKSCCVCAQTNSKLIETRYMDNEGVMLHDLLKFCVPKIDFDEDMYPNFICEYCTKNLYVTYNFIKCCQSTNSLFTLYKSKFHGEQQPNHTELSIVLYNRQMIDNEVQTEGCLVDIKSDTMDINEDDIYDLPNEDEPGEISVPDVQITEQNLDNNMVVKSSTTLFPSTLRDVKKQSVYDSISDPHNCMICNLTVPKKEIRKHLYKHVSRYKICFVCQQRISNKNLLVWHLLKHSLNGDSYSLPIKKSHQKFPKGQKSGVRKSRRIGLLSEKSIMAKPTAVEIELISETNYEQRQMEYLSVFGLCKNVQPKEPFNLVKDVQNCSIEEFSLHCNSETESVDIETASNLENNLLVVNTKKIPTIVLPEQTTKKKNKKPVRNIPKRKSKERKQNPEEFTLKHLYVKLNKLDSSLTKKKVTKQSSSLKDHSKTVNSFFRNGIPILKKRQKK